MGVSISVEWPGSTEEQQGDRPGFYNDDHFWANWLAAVIEQPNLVALLADHDLKVLIYHNTSSLPSAQIGWATPDEFERAARRLFDLVRAKDPRIAPLVDAYRPEWDRICGDPPAEEAFMQDLSDVVAIARYAQSQGARKMTLGYYW